MPLETTRRRRCAVPRAARRAQRRGAEQIAWVCYDRGGRCLPNLHRPYSCRRATGSARPIRARAGRGPRTTTTASGGQYDMPSARAARASPRTPPSPGLEVEPAPSAAVAQASSPGRPRHGRLCRSRARPAATGAAAAAARGAQAPPERRGRRLGRRHGGGGRAGAAGGIAGRRGGRRRRPRRRQRAVREGGGDHAICCGGTSGANVGAQRPGPGCAAARRSRAARPRRAGDRSLEVVARARYEVLATSFASNLSLASA